MATWNANKHIQFRLTNFQLSMLEMANRAPHSRKTENCQLIQFLFTAALQIIQREPRTLGMLGEVKDYSNPSQEKAIVTLTPCQFAYFEDLLLGCRKLSCGFATEIFGFALGNYVNMPGACKMTQEEFICKTVFEYILRFSRIH